tara:strand:+ start:5041 stop:5808 length:768 start_codon:yes stop_codon:yes gene_type:complete
MSKILILARDGDSTKILFHRLSLKYELNVVIENSLSKRIFYKRRIKKMGVFLVTGQILFMIFTKLFLKHFSKSMIKSINQKNNFKNDVIPNDKIRFVNSINSEHAREIIKNSDADFIVVSGTRIICKKTLECTQKKFLNIHAGITPSYRGVHGGYWALVNNEPELCGVTLHYLDEGVDTGSIIGHKLIVPSKKDNFLVYPLLQLAEGLKMLEMYLNSNTELNKITTFQGKPLSSKQYYHPTLWEYLYYRLTKGIK